MTVTTSVHSFLWARHHAFLCQLIRTPETLLSKHYSLSATKSHTRLHLGWVAGPGLGHTRWSPEAPLSITHNCKDLLRQGRQHARVDSASSKATSRSGSQVPTLPHDPTVGKSLNQPLSASVSSPIKWGPCIHSTHFYQLSIGARCCLGY